MSSASTPNHSPFYTVVLLREQEIAAQLRTAFTERYLPEHLFYWLPASVKAWVDLCRSTEYRNASRALEVLDTAAPELGRHGSDIRTLCGLGCGEGSKDRLLLEGFARADNRLNFVAADSSQALLELAIEQISGIAASGIGFKLDVFNDTHLQLVTEFARSLDSPAMFSVLGNTLGAFDSGKFPARLREHCGQGDRFLFDGEIFDEATIAGYDNPTNRRFAWGPLTGVGVTEEDGKLEFSTAPAGVGLYAVTKHFVATRDLRINLGGEVIEISAGEKLRMSSSIKYADEATLFGAVQAARFQIDARWTSRDRKFVLACAKPT